MRLQLLVMILLAWAVQGRVQAPGKISLPFGKKSRGYAAVGPTPPEPQEGPRPTPDQINATARAFAAFTAVPVPSRLRKHVRIDEASGPQYVLIESLKEGFPIGSIFVSRGEPTLPFDNTSYLGALLMYVVDRMWYMADDYEMLMTKVANAKKLQCYYVRVLNPSYSKTQKEGEPSKGAVQLHSFTMSRKSTSDPFGLFFRYEGPDRMTSYVQRIIEAKRNAKALWSSEMDHIRCFTNASHYYHLSPGDTAIDLQVAHASTQVAVRLANSATWRLCDRRIPPAAPAPTALAWQ